MSSIAVPFGLYFVVFMTLYGLVAGFVYRFVEDKGSAPADRFIRAVGHSLKCGALALGGTVTLCVLMIVGFLITEWLYAWWFTAFK